MKSAAVRHAIAALSTLFYLTILLQWMWASLPFLPQILHTIESMQSTTNSPVEPILTAAPSTPPSMITVTFGSIVIIAIIVATIYAFIKLPSTIIKSGDAVTRVATTRIIPIVTHHKVLPAKKQRQITARVQFYVKLSLCILPIIITALSWQTTSNLAYDITMLVAATLGIIAVGLLSVHALASAANRRRTLRRLP
ncbi:MAG: hypothetical protein ABIR91_02740 [Candidatus Saccharimonadales bacterium]